MFTRTATAETLNSVLSMFGESFTVTPKRFTMSTDTPMKLLAVTGAALIFVGGVAIGTQWERATMTPPAPAVPACVTEDAPGPCFWDAETTGNGYGHSYFVDEHGTVYYQP